MPISEQERQIIIAGRLANKSRADVEQALLNYKLGIKKPTPPPPTAPVDAAHSIAEGIRGATSAVMSPIMKPINSASSAINKAFLGEQADQQGQALLQAGAQAYHDNVPQPVQDAVTIGAAALPIGGAISKALPEGAIASGIKNAGEAIPSMPAKAGIAEGLQARATRISKGARIDFTELTGMTPEAFQVKYGATGTPDQVVSKLYEQFTNAREAKKANFKAAKPVKTQDPIFDDAISALEEKIAATSTKNAPSPIAQEVAQLRAAQQQGGLTLYQQEVAKELYERYVKIAYHQENLPDKVALATTIDKRLRTAVERNAEKVGVKGVKEQNKIIQATRMLMDEIGKASNGRAANNILGLTDTILASQIPATPEALALFLAKKTLSSETALGAGAKMLAPTPAPSKVIQSTAPFNPVAELGGMSSGTKSSKPLKATSTSTSSKPIDKAAGSKPATAMSGGGKGDLIEEAKKYKTSDDFVDVYTKQFRNIQLRIASIFDNAKTDKTGKRLFTNEQQSTLDQLLAESQALPDLTKLTEIWEKANKK